jgi:hypothetical protein
MRSTSFAITLAAAAAAALMLAACGGPSDPPPGPLPKHFQDTFLASLPLDQRKEEIAAKSAYDVAVLEQAKAEADLNDSRMQLDVAKNERDAAVLDERSAKTRQEAANKSADMNRIKEADTEMKGVELARKAAEQRYQYIVAYRKWLQRLVRYTQENTYWRESQYELAQAKLAQKNNIMPSGFVFDDYVKQEAARAKRTTDAKAKAEKEKQAALAVRKDWVALQSESDKVLGKKSQFPDPLNPAAVRGVDPAMGAGGYTVGSGGGNDDTQPVQDPTMKKAPDPEPAPEDKQDGGGGEGGETEGGGTNEP